MSPRMLDLFCGAGGAGAGYRKAGFYVVGVDIEFQVNYPYRFVQLDALKANFARFDIVAASPPCQKWSISSYRTGKDYPDLLTPMRKRLLEWGGPYIIENVPGAPLRRPVMVCAGYFGLGAHCKDGTWRALKRHRMFESNLPLTGTGCHCTPGQPVIGVYGRGSAGTKYKRGYQGLVKEREEAMGMDWAYSGELAQAIPPVYTTYLGEQLMKFF